MDGKGILTEELVKYYAGGAADLEGITFLSIINKNLIDVSILSRLINLISLDLTKNSISTIGGMATCSHLRYLKLAFNKLGESTLRELITFPFLPNLRVLDLSHNPIDGDGVREFFIQKVLPLMTELKTLSIDHCPFAMSASDPNKVDNDFMSLIVDTACNLTTLNGIRVRTLSGFVMESIADQETMGEIEKNWRDNSEKLLEEMKEMVPDISKWIEEDSVDSILERLPKDILAEGENSIIPEAENLMKKILDTTKTIQSFIENMKQDKDG